MKDEAIEKLAKKLAEILSNEKDAIKSINEIRKTLKKARVIGYNKVYEERKIQEIKKLKIFFSKLCVTPSLINENIMEDLNHDFSIYFLLYVQKKTGKCQKYSNENYSTLQYIAGLVKYLEESWKKKNILLKWSILANNMLVTCEEKPLFLLN